MPLVKTVGRDQATALAVGIPEGRFPGQGLRPGVDQVVGDFLVLDPEGGQQASADQGRIVESPLVLLYDRNGLGWDKFEARW